MWVLLVATSLLGQASPPAGSSPSPQASDPGRAPDAPKVVALELEGIDGGLERELLDAMTLRPSGPFTWLTRRDRLQPETLEADLERLRMALLARGFLQASVGPARVEPAGPERVRVAIPIVPGLRYVLARLVVDPGPRVPESEARAWFPVPPGAFYDGVAVRRGTERLAARYRDLGHAGVVVDLRENTDPITATVRVEVAVQPGLVFRVGRLSFRGNRSIRDTHLRQYLRVREGERFSTSALAESARLLAGLGYLSAIRPELELRPDLAAADVTYQVEEGRRIGYTAGGGASGLEGASLNGAVQVRSIAGPGEWTLQADTGPRLSASSLFYRDPFSIGRRLTWTLGADHRRVEYPDDTTDEALAAVGRVGGPAGAQWQGGVGFRIVRARVESTLTEPVTFLTPFIGESIDSHRLLLDATHDGTDGSFFPASGLRIAVGGELAGGVLGGELDLIRAASRVTWIRPLDAGRRHLVALRGRGVRVWSFGDTIRDGLPRFERLFLGGEDDLRGFDVRGVGPRDAAGIVIGGDVAAVMSAEYQLAVSPGRLHLVGFVDAGNAWATDHADPERPALRWDAGGEIQLVVPVVNLPLRAGYGVNLDRRAHEPRGRFFVSLGPRF